VPKIAGYKESAAFFSAKVAPGQSKFKKSTVLLMVFLFEKNPFILFK
jgi:hypothetical protein